MTQEFHISVTPVGQDGYLVRTERVAPGVPLAEEQVIWPVEAWLDRARKLINDPLVDLLEGNGNGAYGDRLKEAMESDGSNRSGAKVDFRPDVITTQPVSSLVALGQQLYTALFSGSLRDSWMTAQGIAQHRREMLRLRLGLKGKRLLQLPWEVLHAGDRPLATGTDVVFSRYQISPGMVSPSFSTPGLRLEPEQPLRILMAIAAPTDQERLDLKREVLHLQEELLQGKGLGAADMAAAEVQLTILEQPDREQLTQALEQGHYHVLHYAGHSNPGSSGGDLYLVSGRTGLTETLSGDDLAGLLVNNGVRMAVFNSCRGAYGATIDLDSDGNERNLAEALTRRGVPGVLAMAERIPDEVALTLTRLFYRNLKKGFAVDLSLSRARQGLVSAYSSHQLYWALPILYLHPDFDGRLMPSDSNGAPSTLEPMAAPSLSGGLADPLELWPSGVTAAPFYSEEELADPNPSDSEADPLIPVLTSRQTTPEARMGRLPLRQATVPEDEPALNGLGHASQAAVPAIPPIPPYPDFLEESSELEPLPAVPLYGDEPDELADLVDTLESDNPLEYEADAAIVSELIRKLSQGGVAQDDLMGDEVLERASSTENLLPNQAEPRKTDYLDLPENPRDRPKGADGAEESPQEDLPARPDVEPTPKLSFSITPETSSRPSGLSLKALVLYSGLLVGWFGVAVGTFLGVSALRGVSPLASFRPPTPMVSPSDSPVGNLKQVPTGTLTTLAITQLSQGDLASGQTTVEELFDRGAVDQAGAALTSVPSDRQDNPAYNYLRGRWVWEQINRKNGSFSIDDGRRYWERAVQAKPKEPLYRNALGFAYYAEGNWPQAEQQWREVVRLLEPSSSPSPGIPGILAPTVVNRQIQTAYAGLALVAGRLAENQSPDDRVKLLEQAKGQYQRVMAMDPLNFQSQALGKNWLWPEKAIKDWQALSQ